MFEDDPLIDPPEFDLPTRLEFDCVLPLRDQERITKAARSAFYGQHEAAEEHRAEADYGGLGDDLNQYPRRYHP